MVMNKLIWTTSINKSKRSTLERVAIVAKSSRPRRSTARMVNGVIKSASSTTCKRLTRAKRKRCWLRSCSSELTPRSWVQSPQTHMATGLLASWSHPSSRDLRSSRPRRESKSRKRFSSRSKECRKRSGMRFLVSLSGLLPRRRVKFQMTRKSKKTQQLIELLKYYILG